MRSAPVLTETMPRGIRFAYCALDTSSGELKKRGVRVRLQYQPFQVLSMLIARPGELVAREEIQRALWPSGTFGSRWAASKVNSR